MLAAGDPEQLKKDSVTKEMAHPTMEDAFIALIENFEDQG